MKLFRSIVSLGTKFLSMFSSSLNDPPKFIPSKELPLDVGHWWTAMENYFKSQPLVQEYAIKEMVWAKEDDLIGHEFVAVKTWNGCCLRLDRSTELQHIKAMLDSENPVDEVVGSGASKDIPEGQKSVYFADIRKALSAKCREFVEGTSKLIVASNNFSKSSSDSLQSASVPRDFVYWIDPAMVQWSDATPVQGYHVLFAYSFPLSNPPFTLRELGIIANVVHESKKEYKWHGANCYWFARVVASIVEVITMTTPRETKFSNCAGRPNIPKNRPYIKVTPSVMDKVKPATLRDLVNEVRTKIDEDNKRIHEACEEKRLAAQAKSAVASEAKMRQEKAEAVRDKEESEAKLRESEAKLRESEAKSRESEAKSRESEAKMRREKEEAEAKYQALLQTTKQTDQAHMVVASSSMTNPVAA